MPPSSLAGGGVGIAGAICEPGGKIAVAAGQSTGINLWLESAMLRRAV